MVALVVIRQHTKKLFNDKPFFSGMPDLNFVQRVFGAGRKGLLLVVLRPLVLQALLTFVTFYEVADNAIIYNEFETLLFIAQRFGPHQGALSPSPYRSMRNDRHCS
jgi:hypothetical protein